VQFAVFDSSGIFPEMAALDTSSNVLQLNAFMFRADAVPLQSSGEGRLYDKEERPHQIVTKVFNATSIITPAKAVNDCVTFLKYLRSEVWKAIFFGRTKFGSFLFIIVEQRGTVFERVGSFEIYCQKEAGRSVHQGLTNKRQSILLARLR
jgi:hypothetical protein